MNEDEHMVLQINKAVGIVEIMGTNKSQLTKHECEFTFLLYVEFFRFFRFHRPRHVFLETHSFQAL